MLIHQINSSYLIYIFIHKKIALYDGFQEAQAKTFSTD